MKRVAVLAAVLASASFLAGCASATGKAEVPDGVKRYTGRDEGCHTGGLGALGVVSGVNKTVAGATKGVVQSSVQGMTYFNNPVSNILYAPFGIVGGVFTGVVDGVGHVPAHQNCHSNFGPSLQYAWTRDYKVGTSEASVPEHSSRDGQGGYLWNGGAYWPGGPR